LSNLLIIFAKAPIPGLVKTRLFPHLSFEEAAELHGAFLADTVDTALSVPDTDACIAYTPDESLEVLRGLYGERIATYMPQEGPGLGERMDRAFGRAFETGAQRAAIIGSDIPTLPAGYITEAFRLLDDADLVLGPSEDGGYYLVALKRPAPGIFEGIDWSGPKVFEDTMSRARSLGLRVDQLPKLNDVDTIDDLKRLSGSPLPAHTSRVVSKFAVRLKAGHVWNI